MGADWVELDVRRTADDALAVHHDAHLADGRLVAEAAADDLPDAVPLLAAALDACAGMGVNIEIKSLPGEADHDAAQWVAREVAGLVGMRGAHAEVLVSSFDPGAVAAVLDVDATIPTASLVLDPGPAGPAAEQAAASGVVALHPHDAFVDRALVEATQAAGLAVNVWTVDDESRMAELTEMGVDGIFTNRPDLGRLVVDRERPEA